VDAVNAPEGAEAGASRRSFCGSSHRASALSFVTAALSRAAHRGRAAYWATYAILFMASVAPVWMVTTPPLADYPNHLARMHIVANGAQSELLGRFYTVSWSVIPNLAMDIIVPTLAKFMPLEIAGKVFVTLILGLLVSGSLALHYAIHKRLSPWPLLVFLFLYNGIFLYGMVNYLFGIGLCLWAIAAWIETSKYGHIARVVLFYTTCVILFFAHCMSKCLPIEVACRVRPKSQGTVPGPWPAHRGDGRNSERRVLAFDVCHAARPTVDIH
jgi:hypothetical protein